MKPTPTSTALRDYRTRQGLSQSKTAALLGIPLQTLQNWEAGRNEPRGFTAKALMEKLSTTQPNNQ